MLENNFGAVIPPHISSFQGYYFAQPQAALMKGKVSVKRKRAKEPHSTLGESVGKITGNILGVMPSNRRTEREAGMASHEHPPAWLCSVSAVGVFSTSICVGSSHSLHSTILRCSAHSVPSVPRVVKRERKNNKKPPRIWPWTAIYYKINRLFQQVAYNPAADKKLDSVSSCTKVMLLAFVE